MACCVHDFASAAIQARKLDIQILTCDPNRVFIVRIRE
jgi:hypothetical protein